MVQSQAEELNGFDRRSFKYDMKNGKSSQAEEEEEEEVQQ